jgi:hypothetical protein
MSDDDDINDIDDIDDGIEPILGNSWMRKSSSVDFMPSDLSNVKSGNSANAKSIYVDVGINGRIFGTGPLSERMHDAIMSVIDKRTVGGVVNDGLRDMYLLYAMDASAKEAVRAALDGSGYALDLDADENMQDEGSWGTIDGVSLIYDDDDIVTSSMATSSTASDGGTTYPNFADAISSGNWRPGIGYSFVVREVPARRKAMDLAALLRALDPDGKLREEAKERGIVLPGEEDDDYDDDDEVRSLSDLLADCQQRVRSAPYEVARDEDAAYRGGSSKGYDVISRRALLTNNRNADGTENERSECTSYILLVV